MSLIGKRKTEDVTLNGFYADDRPTLKRRGTTASQPHIESQNNFSNHNNTLKYEEEQNSHDRNDSAMSNHNEELTQPFTQQLPTPPLHQDEFMNGADEYPLPGQQHHHQYFGQQHQQQRLQALYTSLTAFIASQNLSSLEPHLPTSTQPQTFIVQARHLIQNLNSHLTSLQNIAISQLKLRTQMSSLGVTQSVISNLDSALQGLDTQMMEFMVGLQGIEMEVDAIEAELSSASQHQNHVTEVAML
ncbi:hypothetical protein CB0940_07937 [Cercospora beticola]|uniref:Uncharacterized protein n=1 Tax=Cercospora beticola TaxID=122368 RepID=A0A2G5HA73_CERBT|nr:hypothetical protein CB0940_07937 [Cercospora beticola]PIA89434.1 hypothetical protein CB0940_07937 [Cercospora beticola]